MLVTAAADGHLRLWRLWGVATGRLLASDIKCISSSSLEKHSSRSVAVRILANDIFMSAIVFGTNKSDSFFYTGDLRDIC
jgi:hypothetical protein